MEKTPLSDDEVYELLHRAWLLFNGVVVATPLGHDVVTVMLHQIELMQRAVIIASEGDGTKYPNGS